MFETFTDPTLPIEERAKEFATAWHGSINQVRQYTGEPYITHPAAVVEIVRSVTNDPVMLAAAWMHDVLEDTPCTHIDMEAEFGAEVTDLVIELTNVATRKDGNRATRRAIDRAHIAQASPRAKTIKCADVIHNLSTILDAPRDFAIMYVREKMLLLEVLKEADPRLLKRAQDTVQWALDSLGLTEPAAVA